MDSVPSYTTPTEDPQKIGNMKHPGSMHVHTTPDSASNTLFGDRNHVPTALFTTLMMSDTCRHDTAI